MEITPEGRYLLYRVSNDYETETHLLIDLKTSLVSISQLVSSFGDFLVGAPPAFVARTFELGAKLEDEAVLLLDDNAISDHLDEWEEEHPRSALVDHLTKRPFSAQADASLLLGEDLLSLFDGQPPEWDFPYDVVVRLRADETGQGVYVATIVTAAVSEHPQARTAEFYGHHRQPWSKMVYQLAHFAGVP